MWFADADSERVKERAMSAQIRSMDRGILCLHILLMLTTMDPKI